jgi:hypothetical protein
VLSVVIFVVFIFLCVGLMAIFCFLSVSMFFVVPQRGVLCVSAVGEVFACSRVTVCRVL